MADVTLFGFTVPSQPNLTLALFNTDALPELYTSFPAVGDTPAETTPEQGSVYLAIPGPDAKSPVAITAVESTLADLLLFTLSAPVFTAGATQTHGATGFSFTAPLDGPTTNQFTLPIVPNFAPPTVTAAGGLGYVDLTWSSTVLISSIGLNPATWAIVGITGRPVSVTGVSQTGPNAVRVTTTEQTIGGSYTISVPEMAVLDTVTGNPNLAASPPFTGVGIYPSFGPVSALDATLILLNFSEPVVDVEALNLANYAILPALTKVSIVKRDATSYEMTVANMNPNTTYTITVSGIHDLAGNVVT